MLALCRSLIALGRAIVPVAMREDWTQEWRAELWHAAERMDDGRSSARDRLSLVCRCAGAVVHALWLRKEDWSFAVLMQDLRFALRAAAMPARLCGGGHRHACRRHRRQHDGLQRRPGCAAETPAIPRPGSPRPDLGDEPSAQLDARDRGAGKPARLEDAQSILRRHRLLHRVRHARGMGVGPDAHWLCATRSALRAMAVSSNFFSVLGRASRLRPDVPRPRTPPGADERCRAERCLLATPVRRRSRHGRANDRSRRHGTRGRGDHAAQHSTSREAPSICGFPTRSMKPVPSDAKAALASCRRPSRAWRHAGTGP